MEEKEARKNENVQYTQVPKVVRKARYPSQGFSFSASTSTPVVIHTPNEPKSYIAVAILAVFFCVPCGIAAVVYSIKTREANLIGDLERARKTSKQAKRFTLYAFYSGLIFIALIVLLIMLIINKSMSGR